MSTPSSRYLIDTSSLIEAKRRYYRFGFCPAFWDGLLHHEPSGMVCTIDKVYDEMCRGNDELKGWAQGCPPTMFNATSTSEVMAEYGRLQAWANGHRGGNGQPFIPAALAEFARAENADAFLAAYAKVHGYTVVTEEMNDGRLGRVLLPVACDAIGVPWLNTFDMLDRLGGRMTWTP